MNQTISIPKTELKNLSPMGLGCAQTGLRGDFEASCALFDHWLDLGGNVVDTARVYSDWIPGERGRSERVIGDWLKRSGKRNEVFLFTKGGHADMTVKEPDPAKVRLSREEMTLDLHESLQSLHTDHIDLYYYHRDDENRTVEELIETMESFVRAGKIRYYGCSNWKPERIRMARAYCSRMGYRGFVSNQIFFNLAVKNMGPSSDPTLVLMEEGYLRYLRETDPDMLTVAYAGNAGGFFQKLLSEGVTERTDRQYLTLANQKIAEVLPEIMERRNATALQAVLGYFSVLPFPVLPLFGARDPKNLTEAFETFRIGFDRTDYPEEAFF